MRPIAYVLVTLGFLAASYVAVLDSEVVEWGKFLLALSPGVVGVGLLREARRREASHEERRVGNLNSIRRSLDVLVEQSDALFEQRDDVDVYDFRHRIDDDFVGPISDFVEARETVGDTWGLQAYADLMSEFAAGERYLNRVWSASTDGYIDEAHTFLERARDQFRGARSRFQELEIAAN